jgi:hypothetical protein
MSATSNYKNKFLTWTISLLLVTIKFQNFKHDQKEKNVNNTMPIVIEFIENTNFKIQMWIMKIAYKLYTYKTREHKILKAQKSGNSKLLKPKQQTKP